MKREIKFKAKRLDNGEWVKGDLVHSTSYVGISYPSDEFSDVPVVHRVDPKTICQFTGKKDKNGTPIYEGDTVIYKDNNGERRGEISWVNQISSFSFGCGLLLYFPTNCMVVVGNKFNKEK